MLKSEMTIKKPAKRSRKHWEDLRIPKLFLSTVKNHKGKISKNRVRFGLAETTSPNKIPDMQKNITELFTLWVF